MEQGSGTAPFLKRLSSADQFKLVLEIADILNPHSARKLLVITVQGGSKPFKSSVLPARDFALADTSISRVSQLSKLHFSMLSGPRAAGWTWSAGR